MILHLLIYEVILRVVVLNVIIGIRFRKLLVLCWLLLIVYVIGLLVRLFVLIRLMMLELLLRVILVLVRLIIIFIGMWLALLCLLVELLSIRMMRGTRQMCRLLRRGNDECDVQQIRLYEYKESRWVIGLLLTH